jgi:hypothetical protein
LFSFILQLNRWKNSARGNRQPINLRLTRTARKRGSPSPRQWPLADGLATRVTSIPMFDRRVLEGYATANRIIRTE